MHKLKPNAGQGVDAHVSDLFFNRDLTHCRRFHKSGDFSHFDEAALAAEACEMLHSLEGLGVSVPSGSALVADFLARL